MYLPCPIFRQQSQRFFVSELWIFCKSRCNQKFAVFKSKGYYVISTTSTSSLLPLMLKHKTRFFAINAMQVMIRKLLLPFSQLVDIKEPSVLVESVLWTPYSLEYESNHPCSSSVWQSCVSICYFQIVLHSANKTGCLRRWWGSPSCSSSAPAPLPQQYKRRPSVMSPPRQIHLSALGEKGEPSAAWMGLKQRKQLSHPNSRNKIK